MLTSLMSEESKIVRAVVANERTIAIEVTPIEGGQPVDERVANLPKDFGQLADSIEAISRSLYEAIKKVAPKKASVEFGVEVGLESGQLTALLVKGTGKANLKVTLEWS